MLAGLVPGFGLQVPVAPMEQSPCRGVRGDIHAGILGPEKAEIGPSGPPKMDDGTVKDSQFFDPYQAGPAPRRVLVVLAEAERGEAGFQAADLATALGSDGVAVTVLSCKGRVPLGDTLMRAFARSDCGLDLAPHLLDFEATVEHLASLLSAFDAVISFQDVADIYPALDRLHWRPRLIEVGATPEEAMSGPKHHTSLYVALNAETAAAVASRADADRFPCWVLSLPDAGPRSSFWSAFRRTKPADPSLGEKWLSALRFVLRSVRPAPAPSVFRSFWQGGFECSTHRRADGHRVDVLATTGHDLHPGADFAQLAGHGIATCRSGLRWHVIEPEPGRFDFSSFTAEAKAARAVGTQVIWDLMHYGYPDDVDPWSPAFVDRFTAFARRAAIVLRDIGEEAPFWCPVNEISFLAWGGGDVGYLNPFGKDRGLELKVQLARAAIAAAHAVREVDPRARLVASEPLISIRDNASDPAANHLAHQLSQAQFQACDFLTGRSWPQLGGSTDLLDVIGLNYYPPNQWTLGKSPVGPGHPLYRPLSDLLTEVHARYGKPMFLAETGAEGDARAAWFTEVTAEVLRARSRGVPVEGICLYPIVNHVGWDDDRICPNGLLGHEPRSGGRTVHQPLADALLMARLQFDHSLSRQSLHA
jgi:hypothetical protein